MGYQHEGYVRQRHLYFFEALGNMPEKMLVAGVDQDRPLCPLTCDQERIAVVRTAVLPDEPVKAFRYFHNSPLRRYFPPLAPRTGKSNGPYCALTAGIDAYNISFNL
jgi:hypothetical protein